MIDCSKINGGVIVDPMAIIVRQTKNNWSVFMLISIRYKTNRPRCKFSYMMELRSFIIHHMTFISSIPLLL